MKRRGAPAPHRFSHSVRGYTACDLDVHEAVLNQGTELYINAPANVAWRLTDAMILALWA